MSRLVKVQRIVVPNDAESPTIFTSKIRPNDPCPCGSGKKAKKCCGTERKYSYQRHINYIRREENLSDVEKFKLRDGQQESRWCFEIGGRVVISENHSDEAIRNKTAVVEFRGLCHDLLHPYYIVIIDGEDKVYGKWIKEEDLQHLII